MGKDLLQRVISCVGLLIQLVLGLELIVVNFQGLDQQDTTVQPWKRFQNTLILIRLTQGGKQSSKQFEVLATQTATGPVQDRLCLLNLLLRVCHDLFVHTDQLPDQAELSLNWLPQMERLRLSAGGGRGPHGGCIRLDERA